MERYFIGMNKWGHDASACLMTFSSGGRLEIEMRLKERFTRAKKSSGTLEAILRPIRGKIDPARCSCAENSSIRQPSDLEDRLAERYPNYFEQLSDLGLQPFYRHFNRDLRFVSHHRCHAFAAAAVSPFRRSVILVMDGAGNYRNDFAPGDEEAAKFPSSGKRSRKDREWCSVYLQDGPNIRCVEKNWQSSLGHLFEQGSRYIFNSPMDAGKVMGLAPYGRPRKFAHGDRYILGLDRKIRFKGRGKGSWERSGNFDQYASVASSLQNHFERKLLQLIASLRKKYPDYPNLIFTGGCALNCVANMKIWDTRLFDGMYIPPFPGDESISFGAAAARLFETPGFVWRPVPWKKQLGNFGPKDSIPSRHEIRKCFSGYRIQFSDSVEELAAGALASGKIVGWFQGRSESGPRALGFRSILAQPFHTSMRDDLNARVKKREAFRPYGGSCLWEKAHEYFDVPRGFESPFMSFAPRIKPKFAHRLKAIRHVDGSSRIQTVRKETHPRFHHLLKAFGRKTGVYCVLNTSMNVMGEPIVESLEDARRFFEKTPVDAIVVENAWILRR